MSAVFQLAFITCWCRAVAAASLPPTTVSIFYSTCSCYCWAPRAGEMVGQWMVRKGVRKVRRCLSSNTSIYFLMAPIYSSTHLPIDIPLSLSPPSSPLRSTPACHPAPRTLLQSSKFQIIPHSCPSSQALHMGRQAKPCTAVPPPLLPSFAPSEEGPPHGASARGVPVPPQDFRIHQRRWMARE